jgi:hypothetical protein
VAFFPILPTVFAKRITLLNGLEKEGEIFKNTFLFILENFASTYCRVMIYAQSGF